ncbi:34908_t:CDS:1 [Gigaspora margarita]|nr:34908_t:CDS:1 [Gigaspora margarita]
MFEFSCGVAYDIVGWSAKNFICKLTLGSNPSSSTKIKDSNISSSNKHYEKKHKNHNSSSHSNHTYHKNNSIKPLSKHSPKIPVWDVDTYDDFGDKDFVSNDEYFTMSTIANKRPDGRRVRSGYL